MIKYVKNFTDYEVLDCGDNEKIERFGDYILRRPDPQAIWHPENFKKYKVNAIYHRSSRGGGSWEFIDLPKTWKIDYEVAKNVKMVFNLKPFTFKHTGIFPEQATNWDFMMNKIKNSNRDIKVLNLFAYTGCATMACSKAGAVEVVHVDASKGMCEWAKENMNLCGLNNNKIRFIVEDCLKFVQREARRGNKYDAIIMDPPSYGRGPNGEMWKFEHNLYNLIIACLDILSDKPLFFLINSYTTGISSTVLHNILKETISKKYGGKIEYGEIGLPIKNNNLVLPCGIFGRWETYE